MNGTPLVPSRPLKALAAIAKAGLWLLLAAWFVMAMVWGALHLWIVPRIEMLRPALEKQAAQMLGVPVRIGSIGAQSEGLIPSFELRDVVLLDPQGREALRLRRVLAALSPRSLLNLGFEQLLIDAPELDIRRAADGRIFVAGLDFSRRSDTDGGAADWFFSQGEFVIRRGLLRWTDEMRDAPPLALSGVDFVVRNSGRQHALRLDATPPPQWGDRFTVAGKFRQPLLSTRSGQWQQWSGQVYAEFARVDLSQLRRHADLWVRIGAGRGALRAWADVERGQLVAGTADVALAEVNVTLDPGLKPLAMQSVSGRLGGRRLPGGLEFRTEGLQFQTVAGQRWPGGNAHLVWTAPQGDSPERGELQADQLDLSALTQIGSHLPLGTATHAALTAYSPKGLVETLSLKWEGPPEALRRYEARGQVQGLEVASGRLAAVPSAQPGVRGLAAQFTLTQDGGQARLALQQGAIDLPGVFEDPVLPLDTLSADVQWQSAAGRYAVTVRNLKFANADAEGVAELSWKMGDGRPGGSPRLPGTLDLQGSLSRADGTRVWRYLPLQVGRDAREYVRESVQQGRATEARFRVRGDLRRFPWADGRDGEFSITARVRDVLYAYVPRSLHPGPPAWPALAQLSGELVFRGNGMQVRDANGRFAGASGLLVRADAQIPDFHNSVVSVGGQFRGTLADSLALVNSSPVAELMDHALDRARGNGPAEVRLQLTLPLSQIDQSKVTGTVTLAGNDLQFTPESPALTRARGAISFSERGFAIVGAQARALGGDVRIEGGTRGFAPAASLAGSDAPTVVRAQGTATAEGLRQAPELGFVAQVARDMSGSAPYALVLGMRQGTPEIQVTSSLQGMALQWPAPLAKPAESALPLRYEVALTRESAAAAASALPGSAPVRLQDRLNLELGRLVAVTYLRDISGAEPRVLRGAIALGPPAEALSLPEQGVSANVQLPAVDLDAWQPVFDRLSAGSPAAGARPAADNPAMGYLPTALALRTRELKAQGRTLHDLVVGGSREGLNWRANVDARELGGYVEYRQPAGAVGGRVFARLARLAVGTLEARDVESLLDQQPTAIPALDIVIEDFELRGRKLGRVEVDAVNRAASARDGTPREWRLNRMSLATPEAELSANGNWVAINASGPAQAAGRVAPERRRTVMNFRLDIADAGGALNRLGMKDVLRSGRGRMEGQVSWAGSPLALDYPSLSGAFNVNVEAGQFLKADPGIAKLLGVLSLQSLPRRLALDFRDVFSEGFAFDFLRGDITIQQGTASTNNLQMKGVNAAVLMEGRADLARETQDIKVVVVPEVNAGTASLVATVINPAVGLGSFLAQMFLRQPLIRAATQEFHVDGTWTDPRVTKVTRSPPPAPAPGQESAR